MTVFGAGSSIGTIPKVSATNVMPMNSTASRTATTVSVVAAFLGSGGLNAGTPLAIASVPVSATEPEAKARMMSSSPSGWSGSRRARQRARWRRALAEDDDPEQPDRDHEQRRADEQVRRDGEDVARLAEPAEVAEGDEDDRGDADQRRRIVGDLGHRRDDLLDGRRRSTRRPS